jgi:hypothetical protein
MYCANCGSRIKPELNYCNRCGAKVSARETEMQKSIAENLSGAVGYIGGFGLVGFIFVVLVLVKNGVAEKALIPISFFYLAALFGICFLIIRQIKNLAGRPLHKQLEPDGSFQTAEQLSPANTAQLEAPREPLGASVTENTTRTFDEVLLKRN